MIGHHDFDHEMAAHAMTKVAAPNIKNFLDQVWSQAAATAVKINWATVFPDLIAVFASLQNPAALAAAVAKLLADIFGSNVPPQLKMAAASVTPQEDE